MLFSFNQLLTQLGQDPLPSDYLVTSPKGLGVIMGVGMLLGILRVFGGLCGNSVLLGRAFVAGDGTDAIRAIKGLSDISQKDNNSGGRVPPRTMGKFIFNVIRCFVALFFSIVAFLYFWIALSCPDTGVWAIRGFVLGTFLGWTLRWAWGYRGGNLDLDDARDKESGDEVGETKV